MRGNKDEVFKKWYTVFFHACQWDLVKISHLTASFPGLYMQQTNKAVAEAALPDFTSAKRQNKICESQIPRSKEGNNL